MNSDKPIVDAVIPVYRPKEEFRLVLRMLKNQKKKIRKIILMLTDDGKGDCPDFSGPGIECFRVPVREFDHGRTRSAGVSCSDADYVLLMTQDAVPVDEFLTERLLACFEQEKVASAYARQLPKEDCRCIEAFTRQFNYPDESRVKSAGDLDTLGVKTYFCSNVAAMYDRKVMEKLGGFTKRTIFNEDMIYAYEVIRAGYRIAYCSEAAVYHSHNYSGKEQLRRNFDLAVSQADHPEIFAKVSSEKEGLSLIKQTVKHLASTKKAVYIPYLFYQSGMKYIGYQLGKHYRSLPAGLVRRLSMNKNYWEEKNGTD